MNELLIKPTPDFIERIEYKSSFDFIASLDRFILHIENHYFRADDVKKLIATYQAAARVSKQTDRSSVLLIGN